jgi:hypothetical protein
VIRSPLIAKPAPDHSGEPGFREWHQVLRGPCAICNRVGSLLRHHVVTENHVRQMGGDPWDLRNALLVGIWCPERCHSRHHSAFRRIELAVLPGEAIAFAVELLGDARAAQYLERYYR